MAPALPAGLIGREAAACVLLGVVLGGARALFPEKGRGAFLPDVLLVGALLLGPVVPGLPVAVIGRLPGRRRLHLQK